MTKLARRFQRALEERLVKVPIRTAAGCVRAKTLGFSFGHPGGRHPDADVWAYERVGGVHGMLFGFAPYRGAMGLFALVYQTTLPPTPGAGASLQLRLEDDTLVDEPAGVVIRHAGGVTLGKGRVAQQQLVDLMQRAAPEAVTMIGGVGTSSWPFRIGSSGDVPALLDSLFVYAFAIEQAKRLLSQSPEAARTRGATARELLPPLDLDVVKIPKPMPDTSGGQGYGLTGDERVAVEMHAVACAVAYFVGHQYNVRAVGKPYDLECVRGNETVHVEVKGTTGPGDSVELTVGEVRHARTFRHTILFVVSDIVLDRRGRARGGAQWVFDPWQPEEGALAPTRFTYSIDRTRGREVGR